MVRRTIAVMFMAGLTLTACGGDDTNSSKVPSRDELVKQIVESGGVDQNVAECAADAMFSALSEKDIALVASGKQPSAAGEKAFTDAVLDCLTPTS